MQPVLSRFLALVLATQAWAGSHPTPPPIVDLGYAIYTGNHLSRASQDEFLGIRYGAAPVGDPRFRAPVLPHSKDTRMQQSSRRYVMASVLSQAQPAKVKIACSSACMLREIWGMSKYLFGFSFRVEDLMIIQTEM